MRALAAARSPHHCTDQLLTLYSHVVFGPPSRDKTFRIGHAAGTCGTHHCGQNLKHWQRLAGKQNTTCQHISCEDLRRSWHRQASWGISTLVTGTEAQKRHRNRIAQNCTVYGFTCLCARLSAQRRSDPLCSLAAPCANPLCGPCILTRIPRIIASGALC